jgi:hypothetical protein
MWDSVAGEPRDEIWFEEEETALCNFIFLETTVGEQMFAIGRLSTAS